MTIEKIFCAEAWDAKNIRSTLRIYINTTNSRTYFKCCAFNLINGKLVIHISNGRQGINVEILLIELLASLP